MKEKPSKIAQGILHDFTEEDDIIRREKGFGFGDDEINLLAKLKRRKVCDS